MAFVVNLINDGGDDVFTVMQRIGNNNFQEVFQGAVAGGASVQFQAQLNPPQRFDWKCSTDSAQDVEVAADGGELHVTTV